MKFLYLWPLFLLILVPVIIIMYLLKQKAVAHSVPSLMLWKEMYTNIEANTPWEKLKKNWLMILQIITLIVLIVAIMSPFILNKGSGADHCVIIIDNSGSMGLAYNSNETRLEHAKGEAADYIKNLKSGTEISLISSANTGVLLVSSSNDKDQVLKRLEDIAPTMFEGNSAAGVELVKSMQSQWPSLETVCFTDSNVDMSALDGYIVDVSSEVKNLCIDYVSHGMSNNKMVVLAKVSNHSSESETRDVSLYGGDELLDVRTVTIAAEESQIVYYDNVQYAGQAIRVEISGIDDFAVDNVAYDVLAEDQTTDVLLMTEANVYLEKAMELVEGLNVTKSSDIYSFNDFGEYDLYIFDNMIPGELPKQGNIIIFNCPCDSLYESSADDLGGRMVDAVKHTVTEYIDDLSFGVSSVHSLVTPLWADPFLEVTLSDEEGNPHNYPVAFTGKKDGQQITVIGFDIHNSELPLKMEFPMLVYNILAESTSSGMLNTFSINAGDGMDINGKLNEGLPTVIRPDELVKELSDYRMTFTDTELLGIYEVKQNVEGKDVSQYFAVNFPSSESFVKDTPSNSSGENGEEVRTSVAGVLNLRNIIILIALGLLGAEWVAYLKK